MKSGSQEPTNYLACFKTTTNLSRIQVFVPINSILLTESHINYFTGNPRQPLSLFYILYKQLNQKPIRFLGILTPDIEIEGKRADHQTFTRQQVRPNVTFNFVSICKKGRLGSCCGVSIGKVVASDIRGPRFESSHQQNLYCTFI